MLHAQIHDDRELVALDLDVTILHLLVLCFVSVVSPFPRLGMENLLKGLASARNRTWHSITRPWENVTSHVATRI